MPKVICNTSPLQYLHQLGLLSILPELAEAIIVPEAVVSNSRRVGLQGSTFQKQKTEDLFWDHYSQLTRWNGKLLPVHQTDATPCLKLDPPDKEAKRLKKRYLKIRDNLFLFLEDSTIPPTNNSSEQALRMSRVFRKVTNCFRSSWRPDLVADMRSVLNSGKRHQLSAL